MPSIVVSSHRFPTAEIDPDEIRRIVAKGISNGTIRQAGQKSTIQKTGQDLNTGGPFRSVWVDITPAMAGDWLRNNFRNRPVSDDVVKSYARDMLAGCWIATHQGIAFNDRDELIDGQHRLLAIVASGATVRMMVTFGMPSEIAGSPMTTMDAVDRGRTRSVADQLKIQHGMKNGSAIAMICASLAAICQNERTRRLSVGQTLEIYAEFRAAIDWVLALKITERGIKAKGVLAAVAFAVTADRTLKPLCHRIFTDQSGEPSMVSQLRDFLVSDAAILLNRSADRGLAELTLQALYLDQTGKRRQTLELAQDGLDFFGCLQPHRVAKIASFFKLPS
jgi:hypothetical protein